MEETIKKLKQFLNQISWSETEVDQYRIKLYSIQGARKKIFLTIDEECKGQITSDDICQFCCVRGIKVNQKTSEIIGRYFRNWKESITYEEFSEIVKPKNLVHQLEDIQIEDPIKVFVKMVNVVIKSFNSLQCIRKQICQNADDIVRYFKKKYGPSQGINKQNLRQFMLDHNFFSRQKFGQICSYIFGETQIQIPWANFLSNKKQVRWQEEDDLKNSAIKQIQSYFPSQKQSRVTSQAKSSRAKSSQAKQQLQRQITLQRKSERVSAIQEVLDQIQKIQRTIKEKKLRNMMDKTQQTVNNKKIRQQFIGKVVSRSSRKQVDPEPVSHSKQNDIDEAQYVIFRSRPKYPQKSQNKSMQRYNSTQKLGQGMLKHSVSEAQLKIDEIQRRAMDKFLSSRRDSYLPQDYHIPYYYTSNRSNMEFIREFGINMHQTGNIRKISSPRFNAHYPIYLRNNTSRIPYPLYEDQLLYRPVSPRLLRY